MSSILILCSGSFPRKSFSRYQIACTISPISCDSYPGDQTIGAEHLSYDKAKTYREPERCRLHTKHWLAKGYSFHRTPRGGAVGSHYAVPRRGAIAATTHGRLVARCAGLVTGSAGAGSGKTSVARWTAAATTTTTTTTVTAESSKCISFFIKLSGDVPKFEIHRIGYSNLT